MKIILLISILLLTYKSYSQWEVIAPSSLNRKYNAIYFVNDSTGYISGIKYGMPEQGIIMKTTDSGNSWTTINTGSEHELFSVHFPSLNHGYCGGKAAPSTMRLLSSSDTGNSWNIMEQGPTPIFPRNIHSLFFVNDSTGYVVGNRNDGINANNNKIYIGKTTNGGVTWGGASPTAINGAFAQRPYGNKVFFIDSVVGFVAGNNNTIMKTTNGSTWSEVSPIQLNSSWQNTEYLSIHFSDHQHGFAVGKAFSGGLIARTKNGGDTWDTIISPIIVTGVFCIDSNKVYIVDGGGVSVSLDGGDSWVRETDYGGDDIFFTKAGEGFVVNSDGSIHKRKLICDGFNVSFANNSIDNIITIDSFCQHQYIPFFNHSKCARDYKWYVNDSLISTQYNFNYTFNQTGNWYVKLIAESTDGSIIDSFAYNYFIIPEPIPDFLVDSNIIYKGDTIVFVNNSENAIRYNWFIYDFTNDTNIVFSLEENLSYVFQYPLTYQVSLIAWNESCFSNDNYSQIIDVFDKPLVTSVYFEETMNINNSFKAWYHHYERIIRVSYKTIKEDIANMYIYDYQGKLLYSESLRFREGVNQKNIEINLSKGVYIVALNISNLQLYKKLLVY